MTIEAYEASDRRSEIEGNLIRFLKVTGKKRRSKHGKWFMECDDLRRGAGWRSGGPSGASSASRFCIDPMTRLLIVLALLLLVLAWFAHGYLHGQDFPAASGKEVGRDGFSWMNDR